MADLFCYELCIIQGNHAIARECSFLGKSHNTATVPLNNHHGFAGDRFTLWICYNEAPWKPSESEKCKFVRFREKGPADRN